MSLSKNARPLNEVAMLTGWPTPAAQNVEGGINPNGNNGNHFTLQTAAEMAGWPTPKTSEHQLTFGRGETNPTLYGAALSGWATPRALDIGRNRSDDAIAKAKQKGGSSSLEDQTRSGWATPQANDVEKRGQPNFIPGQQTCLPIQVGPTLNSSPEMEKRGQSLKLNPMFVCWLMGFGIEWLMCYQRSIRKP